MNNNKKQLIAGSIGGAILVAIVIFSLFNAPARISGISGASSAAAAQASLDASGKIRTAFFNLLSLPNAQSCSFKHEVAGSKSSGTVYVSAGQLSANVTASQTSASIGMIYDGASLYVWNPTTNQGLKMKESPAQLMVSSSPAGATGNGDIEFSCQSWTPSSSRFALPPGINFTDLEQSLNSYSGPSTKTK